MAASLLQPQLPWQSHPNWSPVSIHGLARPQHTSNPNPSTYPTAPQPPRTSSGLSGYIGQRPSPHGGLQLSRHLGDSSGSYVLLLSPTSDTHKGFRGSSLTTLQQRKSPLLPHIKHPILCLYAAGVPFTATGMSPSTFQTFSFPTEHQGFEGKGCSSVCSFLCTPTEYQIWSRYSRKPMMEWFLFCEWELSHRFHIASYSLRVKNTPDCLPADEGL